MSRRPSLPFRTDQPWLMRGRERLADLVHPGGLAAIDAPAPAPAPAEPPTPNGALIERLADRDVDVEPRLLARGPLVRELVAVLSDEDEAALLAVCSAEQRAALERFDPIDRRVVLISIGVAHDLQGVRERTGLSPAMPPDHIHAMSHTGASVGGDVWYADMIDSTLTELGLPLEDGARVLDFGCSSGRVVRMLAARRPGAAFSGCDVNDEAIAWASGALSGIDFRQQPLRPPLSYDDGAFDAVFAISIWSHFDVEPARLWFEEMHRVIRPGGLLLVTTHGPGAVAFRAAHPDHGEETQRQPLVDMYRSGYSFVATFGDEGDWGVVDREWGVSFLSPEWLLQAVTPQWSSVLYRPAAIEGHQDLWVLRREPGTGDAEAASTAAAEVAAR